MFPFQDWALGVLQFKIIICLTLMGPQWWLKRAIEQVVDEWTKLNVTEQISQSWLFAF